MRRIERHAHARLRQPRVPKIVFLTLRRIRQITDVIKYGDRLVEY